MRQRALAVAVLLVASGVRAQVSCGNPDDLCTGDPCVIGNLSVASPCTVDFGSRRLAIEGRVLVPDGGTVDFTAGSIIVAQGGALDGGHKVGAGVGADLTLRASGDVDVNGLLDASSGTSTGGTITIEAGGGIRTNLGTIRTNGKKGYASGGRIVLDGAGITVEGTLEAKTGGSVELSGSAGVLVSHKILTSSSGQGSGQVTVVSGGRAVVRGVRSRLIHISSTQDVYVGGPLVARGQQTSGGTITVDAGTDLTVEAGMTVRSGHSAGGTIDLSAGGALLIHHLPTLDARGASGSPSPGLIRVAGASVSITGSLNARGTGPNPTGGAIRIKAASGDMFLDGSFLADANRGQGGIIEATTTNDLRAQGEFRAVANGCIALAAGGTLDTSRANFDSPVVPDCPGSPSGAFLD